MRCRRKFVHALIISSLLFSGWFYAAYLAELRMALLPAGPVAPGVFALPGDIANGFAVAAGSCGRRGPGAPQDPANAETDGSSTWLLVDAGDSVEALRAGLAAANIAPEKVAAVFLTHSDRDHVGGLPLLPAARLYLRREEKPLVDGTMARLFGLVRNAPLPREPVWLADGDTVEVGARAVVCLAAPGHTPGHSAYLVGSDLFVGDALNLKAGRAVPFFRLYTMDMETLVVSIGRIASFCAARGVGRLLTAHTGAADARTAF